MPQYEDNNDFAKYDYYKNGPSGPNIEQRQGPVGAIREFDVPVTRTSPSIAKQMDDLEKETVDFQLNFDDSLSEPSVLPTRIPQLLVNGSSGIAVGMATNMLPHNLGEVVDGCIAYINNRNITVEELRACTTCNACVEECPVSISPLDIILELRRSLIMEESNAPQEWNSMFSNIENNFAPWKFAPDQRDAWTHQA